MLRLKKLRAEELEHLHLSVLREIGRVAGVKAPAAKNKEELVSEILGIQEGRISPHNYGKSGAPKKLKIDISEFMIDDNDVDYTLQKSVDSRLTFEDSDTSFEVEGVLELHSDGYGFLRTGNYETSKKDIFVSWPNIKKYRLRRGDKVRCRAKTVREGESAALQQVLEINGMNPELFTKRAEFDDLVPCYPDRRIKLETEGTENDLAIRCIDLFAPIGMGQRGLIVAPPKTGKTTLLKKIAQSIEKNYKDIELMVLLIDERPEEVTDIKRSITADVIFSTFDEGAEHHVRAAELAINRAKRLVEVGKDVVILMDSITRLARAYNNIVESSGKTLSGGLDPAAMPAPKRFFGAARNIEDGGSLTILSTALVDTGSRMDDVIYEEFKGTGNMEIHLSRELSERRIFPAIDLYKSGTRREDLLLSEKELNAVYQLRSILSQRADATDSLLEMLKKSKDNADFLVKLDAWIKLYKK
ncbi:MAG: transcription termination factor Rho [Clostridia bacterium]|nr:transcription termination factor Rho [Clostridia bacterium]